MATVAKYREKNVKLPENKPTICPLQNLKGRRVLWNQHFFE